MHGCALKHICILVSVCENVGMCVSPSHSSASVSPPDLMYNL